jgi:pimeloyl-ACP methyl ester carboxylesterase
MLNALNQRSRTLYDHYKLGLSTRFMEHGIASVLLPLTFHFERWPDTAIFRELDVVHLILRDMIRFYWAYRQVVADVARLARDVREGRAAEYKKWFKRDTKIHLLGYSIGGLGALSVFMLDYMKRRNHFETCTLLCSGASFETLEPDREQALGITKEQWQRFLAYYDRQFDPEQHGVDINEVGFRVFERVLRGKEDRQLDKVLCRLSHRVLLIIGSIDDVNSPDSIIPLEPNETGLAVLQIPSLPHILVNSKAWLQWSPFVMKCIADFMNLHARRPVLGG